MADRVVVFVDYQNVHGWAKRKFLQYGSSPSDGHIYPQQLGDLLCRRRQRASELEQVRVYRGRPNPERQSRSAMANDRQTADWERASRVKVIRRNLQYPKNWPETPPNEKGIDVAIAVDMIHMAMAKEYDAAILFSSDKDLLPAIETIATLQLAHVEVAAWSEAPRLRLDGTQKPWCHYLSESEFHSVRDRFDYATD